MFISTHAQFGPQQIISSNAPGASRVIPYDVNKDGFMDILTNSDYKFGWYQNLNGLGYFDDYQYLPGNIPAPEKFELFDMNGDGKLDIIYDHPNQIAWLENLDDQGTFGPAQIIETTNTIYEISVADIDGDGDLDVFANLYNSSITNRFVWY